jgi:endogenous inhibitor of DNA gyrase (YacG/DUF329 family)
MGVYDTVVARCPECGAPVSFQSKAGPCRLHTYRASEVPMAIAADIDGSAERCPDCYTAVTIRIPRTSGFVNMIVE